MSNTQESNPGRRRHQTSTVPTEHMPRSPSDDFSFRTFGLGSANVPPAPGFSGTLPARAPEAAHVRPSPEGGAAPGGLRLSGSLLSWVPTRAREAAVLPRERRHLVTAVLRGGSRSQAPGFPAPPRDTRGGGGAQAAGHASRARSRARGGAGRPRPAASGRGLHGAQAPPRARPASAPKGPDKPGSAPPSPPRRRPGSPAAARRRLFRLPRPRGRARRQRRPARPSFGLGLAARRRRRSLPRHGPGRRQHMAAAAAVSAPPASPSPL